MDDVKLTLLITGLSYGGAETQLVRIATRLKTRGWAVRVVTMLPPQAYLDDLQAVGITVDSLDMCRGIPDPRAICRLVRILRRERPTILTTFMYHANLLGRVAGRLAGVPIIVSSIRNENFGGPQRDRIMRLTHWLDDVTVINSRLAARAIVERGVVPQQKLRVIPNALDAERFCWTPNVRQAARQELNVAEKEFLWLAIGRLEPQKDYPNLLSAFARVARERPEAVLRIVGQGVLEDHLKAMARELGLTERLKFMGVRKDIPRLLAAADALVLASAWEGLPNVVMEAMAAAKPVVATRVGGVPELVEDGVSGFIVPPKNPQALASAMTRLMDFPPDMRARMGGAGRAHVQTNYSVERVLDMWETLYLELLERKRLR